MTPGTLAMVTTEGFFLGAEIDPASGERTETLVDYDPADLTTHGVVVGMTGSGKTGLGVVVLEEALLRGIPALILDPKGDMTNLLLTFPDLAPKDFEPWLDPAEAKREGVSTADLAAAKAELWSKGLADWGLDGSRIAQLRDTVGMTVYTPGSSAGIPLNIVGSLADPGLDWDVEAESLRDQIQGFASGLLGLLGIDADPISSKEHILISNLVEHAWRSGQDLDMARLVGQIQDPPLRKLGVFEIDAFVTPKERRDLARQTQRAARLAGVRGVDQWGPGRDRRAPVGRRRPAPGGDRLPGPPVGRGTAVHRHPAALGAGDLDARPAGHRRPAGDDVHGRGVRVRAPCRRAAGEASRSSPLQTGEGVRDRGPAVDRRTRSTSTTRRSPTPERGASAGFRPRGTRSACSRDCAAPPVTSMWASSTPPSPGWTSDSSSCTAPEATSRSGSPPDGRCRTWPDR